MLSKPKNYVTPEKAQNHAQMLSNRIRNRFRHLSRKFKKQNIDCFRLYDWDIKEVRAVVDWYAGHIVIAEYERLQTGPEWLPLMAKSVSETLNIPPERVHIKRRHTNTKEGPRYTKLDSRNERFQVNERDLRFWVNLDDFLDTGLYSDHRDTRVMISNLAAGKDFLNLYAYTGTFTCAAAFGKAKTTTTVDRSATYIRWALDNMKLNGFTGPEHTFIQSDADRYLEQAYSKKQKFTLAFIDPPSFFQEQSQERSFDIKEGHPELIRKVLKIMAPGSLVFFSTNHQRFEPKMDNFPVKDLIEITLKTIPEDYRNQQVHRCWQMTAL